MKKVIYAILIAALATAMLGGCQDVPEPYNNPNENKGGNQEVLEPSTPTGTGTEADPYNITAALAKIKTLKGGENTGEIFVKGKIRSVKEVDTGNFGNATYFISDDITKKMDSLQIYRSKYLGNAKFTAKDQIKVGDEVVIRGIFVNFKGNTPESEPNKSWIHSLNGKTVEAETLVPGEPKGAGTETEPYNVTAALAKVRALAADGKLENIYVKGKIRLIKSVDKGQYGNATYYISDDNTKKMDSLQIFRSMYLGNAKFTADNQIKVGDEVVIYGTFINFKGNTPETEANKSYIFTLNGKKEAGGTTPEKPETPQTGKGLSIEGQVVTLTAADTEVGTETLTYEVKTLGGADIKPLTSIDLAEGLKMTFDGGGEQNTPTYFAKHHNVRLYKNNSFTITGNKKIAKVILDCDIVQGKANVGNSTATVAFKGNSVTYKNVFSEPKGGGVQMRILKVTVIYAK